MRKSGKYHATIQYKHKTISLGTYSSEKTARRVNETLRAVLIQAEIAIESIEQLRREPPMWAEIFKQYDTVAKLQAIEALKHAVPGLQITLP
jgi:hypothetical protein